jgi:MFS family permease
MALNRTQVTVMLGIAQTLSWASSYYFAVLARPISQSTSTSYSLVFGAFSAALLVAAAVGPIAGRLIDRFGGRSVLLASNLVLPVAC